jgi:DnaA family protein
MENEDDNVGRVSVNPQFLTLDKNFKGLGGRLAYTKDLDKTSSIQAYADLMAGKAAPAMLELREDLRTRLGWGLVFQTELLDDDAKIQALEQAAQARGLVLSPDVLPWLLSRFYRDMPNLMALIDALDAYSLETKRAVTLPLVRELLHAK